MLTYQGVPQNPYLFEPTARKAYWRSRRLDKTNWKVKVHSIIGRKSPEVLSRLSYQAGATRISVRVTKLHTQERCKPGVSDYEKANSARKKQNVLNNTSSTKTIRESRVDNTKVCALVSQTAV
jgi:hypothetical protein